jgi:hypothetical protein
MEFGDDARQVHGARHVHAAAERLRRRFGEGS